MVAFHVIIFIFQKKICQSSVLRNSNFANNDFQVYMISTLMQIEKNFALFVSDDYDKQNRVHQQQTFFQHVTFKKISNNLSNFQSYKLERSLNREGDEQRLVDWILFVGSEDFPWTQNILSDSVTLLIKELRRKNPFTGGRAGKHWFGEY